MKGDKADEGSQAGPWCGGRCPAGRYCPTATSTEPIECPTGSYCEQGSPGGTPCPAGTASSVLGAKSISDCQACPSGTWCGFGAAEPVGCAKGTFTNASMTKDKCEPCAAGQYQDELRQSDCKLCRAGLYCPSGAVAGVPCPDGAYGLTDGLASVDQCLGCPRGHWCNAGKAFPCEVGFYT